MSAWYHPVRFILFCPQNLDEPARESTKYTSFSGPGTLGDEIFHRVIREKLLELAVKLGRQRLVVGNDQCRLLHPLDDIGHGEGLAGTGDAQKGLALVAFLETFDKIGDCLRLVAGGFIF